jgi:hypothetical protein
MTAIIANDSGNQLRIRVLKRPDYSNAMAHSDANLSL